ncbi:hypothetical protein [Blastococcus sp. TF02A-26]|uniref:hypothetical protein n=1 Tax=Blastococcus sp. TF02A-26 TaxID=2250577 RepID=UPI000DE930A1|nr:hypothetical protein [Blastococcus sp. TF02A-26]RBY86187.1 hypothetical protein DQ240_10390 [Blastococcus sp. TF02A-26]
MALRLLIAHTPAERDAARRVEAQVFLEAFGNTPDVMEQEYGPYEALSRFVVVVDDADGSALGTARLITPDDAGTLKTLVDMAGDPWHLPPAEALEAKGLTGRVVWDVATLAVDPRFRAGAAGAEVSLALCHGIWQYSRNCGVDGLVTILDDGVLQLVQAMGLPWFPMTGASSHPYLGSPASTPCDFLVATAGDHVRATQPELAPALVEGRFRSITLDPADLSADRGGPLDEPDPMPVQSAVPRRDTTGWRPPTANRGVTSSPAR